MQFLHRGYPTRPELAMEVAVKHRITHEHGLAITAHALDGKILNPIQPHLTQQRALPLQRSLNPSRHMVVALGVNHAVDALAAS